MTAPDPSITTSHSQPDTASTSTTATATPITVWWLDDHNDSEPNNPTAPRGDRFVTRLTRRLILTYTRRGEAIIDLTGDPALWAAANDCARDYVALTEPAMIADLDRHHRTSMIALPWPTAQHASASSVNDLFLACQLMMNTETCVITITNTHGDIEPRRLNPVLPAATQAGFRHTLTIIAVSCPGQGDRYLFYATANDATAAVAASHPDPTRPVIIVDLFTRDTQPKSR